MVDKLTHSEKVFLEAVKQWSQEEGATLYLPGPVDWSRYPDDDVREMSPALRAALKPFCVSEDKPESPAAPGRACNDDHF